MVRWMVGVLRKSTPAFDESYTWQVPAALAERIRVGQRVLVPFGRRSQPVEAVVFALSDAGRPPGGVDPDRIRPVADILDDVPAFQPDQLRLSTQMKLRYACTRGDALGVMMPLSAGSRPPEAGERVRTAFLSDRDAVLDVLESGEIRFVQQIRVLTYLAEFGETPWPDLMEACQVTPSTLRTLKKKGLIDFEWMRMPPAAAKETDPSAADPPAEAPPSAGPPEHLTPGQQAAVAAILSTVNRRFSGPAPAAGGASASADQSAPDAGGASASADQSAPDAGGASASADLRSEVGSDATAGGAAEFLLHGITGSGKTEVYMQVAEQVLNRGRGAIILVPEIALTPQTEYRFRTRFGAAVSVLHSRLTPRQRYDEWHRIRTGRAQVVVGARSAVFAPLASVGLIVIDEEQESTYQSELKPRYHAATIARLRARDHGAVLVLGSATPSVETYHRTRQGQAVLLRLDERPGAAQLPAVRLVSMSAERAAGGRDIFSAPLLDAMRDAFDRGGQCMLFLNRRGYAGVCVCSDCGHLLECPACDVGWHVHRTPAGARLQCHYCGRTEPVPAVCPACGSPALDYRGIGTQQAAERFHALFPGRRALRMDQDTTAGRSAHADILGAFRRQEADVLIGTQMIAKGHDFPNVTLVGILGVDQMLGQNDFRAAERTFQLLTQAAGRAGRADRAGTVLIQAYDIDHYAVICAARQDYASFYERELPFRRQLRYPPFGRLCLIGIGSRDERLAADTALEIEAYIRSLSARYAELAGLTVLRAAQAPIRRIDYTHRWQILLKHDGERVLAGVMSRVSALRLPDGVHLSLRLDPG